jgi:hypothetical protein
MNHINKQKQGQTNSKEFRHISNSDSNGLDAIRGHAAKHAAAGTPSDQITGLIRAVYIEQRKLDEWESDELKIKVVVEEEIQNHKRQRRQEQRDAARAIGEGKDADTLLVAEKLTLEEAGDRFVFITNGRQVYDLDNPVAPPLSFPDFEATYAYSKHTYNDPKGMPRTKTVAKEWLESPNRKTAPEVTYKPGAGLMTRNPLGTIAVNLWQKKSRKRAPADWQKRIMPFIEHTKYLWADDADTYLDWLAHNEQIPGELPHFGWIHISKTHGLGRNWMSCVLARVWSGNVAPAFDLLHTLESGFNGRLSRCHLAIVDEIYEGGGLQFRHESALRQLITADHRLINPKYGRQRVEFNCCRWLLFSNHTGALPLDANDRRFWVVEARQPMREPEYYKELYHLLNDQDFIASVAAYLAQRDISKFNAGQRPPMNAAKTALVAMAKSEADHLASAVMERWPVDVIMGEEFELLLFKEVGKTSNPRAIAHALDRVGIRRVSRSEGKIRIPGQSRTTTAYIIRNHEAWQLADAHQLRVEQARVNDEGKRLAICDELPPPSTLTTALRNLG